MAFSVDDGERRAVVNATGQLIMANDMLSAANTDPVSAADAVPEFRQLWQIPMFLVGIIAIITAWLIQPYLPAKPAPAIVGELETLRQSMNGEKDPDHAIALGQAILDRGNLSAAHEGEVHFLLGCVYAQQADRLSDAQAAKLWPKAREHLEAAQSSPLPEQDQPALKYRLGQAIFHTGGEPERVIELLSDSLPAGASNAAEGYGLLAQAYLRLPEPDVQSALEASTKQLASPGDDENMLAPARLLRGQLLLRLQQPDEARKVLARVPTTAARGLYVQARLLRAQSLQQDMLWEEAAALWQEIVKDAQDPPAAPGRIWYELGTCYRHLKRNSDADRAWTRALVFEPDVAQAANLRLADLRLLGKDPLAAVECYESALRDVTTPSDYHNTLVGLQEARTLLERGCRFFTKSADYERAQYVAKLYLRIALASVGEEMLGTITDAWAQHCRHATEHATGADRAQLEEEMRTHLREAANAYEAVAALAVDNAERTRWLWASAGRYLEARNGHQALPLLRRLLTLETAPERLGEAWLKLAELQRTFGDEPAALAAYHKCIEFPGRWGFQARYELARVDIQNHHWDDAQSALVQNLDLMRGVEEGEIYKKTLLELADGLVEHGNYQMAVVRYQEALDRFGGSTDGFTIRFQLAECFRKLAAQEDQKLKDGQYLTEEAQGHYREQRRAWIDKAATHYEKLMDDLHSQQKRVALTEAQQRLLDHAGFAAAVCRFEAGSYESAIQLFEQLAARHPQDIEALRALKEVTRCYWAQKNTSKALETIRRARAVFQAMPEEAFARQSAGQSQKDWREWFEWAVKQ